MPLIDAAHLPANRGVIPGEFLFSTAAALRGHIPTSQLNPFVKDLRLELYRAMHVSLPKLEEEVTSFSSHTCMVAVIVNTLRLQRRPMCLLLGMLCVCI